MNKSMKPVSFESSSGNTLRGVIHLSEQLKLGAVLLPGLVGNRVGPHRILYDIANLLSENGISAFRCDLSGTGYSDGDNKTVTIKDLMRDAKDIMDYMEKEYNIREFILGGICRGSKIAIGTSLADPRVKYLMLLSCPRLEGGSIKEKNARRKKEHLKKYIVKLFSPNWIPRLFRGDINFNLIYKSIFRPLNKDALNLLELENKSVDFQQFTSSTIFIYGEDDPDFEDSVNYYKNKLVNYNDKVTLNIVPGANQGFYRMDWHESVLNYIHEWWNIQSNNQ